MNIPKRGELWRVRFDPTEGAEIQKIRPAVVLSVDAVGVLPLRIIVPITEWKEAFQARPWLVRLIPSPENGLMKDSAADAFQVKSLSVQRFVDRIGSLTDRELEEIVASVVLYIGF